MSIIFRWLDKSQAKAKQAHVQTQGNIHTHVYSSLIKRRALQIYSSLKTDTFYASADGKTMSFFLVYHFWGQQKNAVLATAPPTAEEDQTLVIFHFFVIISSPQLFSFSSVLLLWLLTIILSILLLFHFLIYFLNTEHLTWADQHDGLQICSNFWPSPHSTQSASQDQMIRQTFYREQNVWSPEVTQLQLNKYTMV